MHIMKPLHLFNSGSDLYLDKITWFHTKNPEIQSKLIPKDAMQKESWRGQVGLALHIIACK